MSDKAMQAAYDAVDGDAPRGATEGAVRAYLSALADDPEAIEMVRQAIRKAHSYHPNPWENEARVVLVSLRGWA